jgi:transposase
MPRKHNPKPPYPAQFRQQMINLVAAGRRPSELSREVVAWSIDGGGFI